MLNDGERQVSPRLSGIRADHVARYQFACSEIGSGKRVIDVACGVGYGAKLLAEAGNKVTAIDRDIETIEFAREHYAHPNITYLCDDASGRRDWGDHDVAVCFETIEHLQDPIPLLLSLRCAPLLIASAPNEDGFPFLGYTFHFRHYTVNELDSLLRTCGFDPVGFYSQEHDGFCVGPYKIGRTIVVKAQTRNFRLNKPKHVTILGLGPSLNQYLDIARKQGNRRVLSDEIWGINVLGDLLQCDRVFHMDDVRIQEVRAAAQPQSNIAEMLKWLRNHPGPVYTSRSHPDYPGLVDFPLEQVINRLGYPYFNNTAAYAIAYAIFLGVEAISLFGIDFTWPNAHHAEAGRGCVEFWLGYAHARGIQINCSGDSSLLDGLTPEANRLYGYDTLNVEISDAMGVIRVEMTPKTTPLPTAAEIESRYDHGKHPNPMVQAELEKVA